MSRCTEPKIKDTVYFLKRKYSRLTNDLSTDMKQGKVVKVSIGSGEMTGTEDATNDVNKNFDNWKPMKHDDLLRYTND